VFGARLGLFSISCQDDAQSLHSAAATGTNVRVALIFECDVRFGVIPIEFQSPSATRSQP
jgi:hypothetical protein